MGDSGEYWKDFRNHKKERRSHSHECPTCAVAFGTGTKVMPGGTCRNCGWVAPNTSAWTGKPWRPNTKGGTP